MDQLYIDILHNRPARRFKARTPETAAQYQITITSTLWRILSIKLVDSRGRWHEEITLQPKPSQAVLSANANDRFVITDNFTDALVGAFEVPEGGFPGNQLKIDDSFLVMPNDLGPPPQPTKTTIVPQDSYPVVVGWSVYPLPTGQLVGLLRYQYWHRSDDSYALGVGEKQTITTSTTTGLVSTSSTLQSVAASLGMSASVSWWVVSASVNASLNVHTTTQQSVTVSETSTTYISKELTNTSNNDIIVIHWQLIDTVMVSNELPQKPGDLLSTFSVSYAPSVVQTYTISQANTAKGAHE